MSIVKRGDIFYADLSPVVGSEQGGMRPVLIVQNDTGNKQSPTVSAAAITRQTDKAKLQTHKEPKAQSVGGVFPLMQPATSAAAKTSQTGKARLPTHIELNAQSVGLTRDSVILLEQIRTIDKSRLRERMGKLDDNTMTKVDNAIAVSFGL